MSKERKAYIIKYGEIALKGENLYYFLNKLKRNIKVQLSGIPSEIIIKTGRLYVYVDAAFCKEAEEILCKVIGIVRFSAVEALDKDLNIIKEKTVEIGRQLVTVGTRFKVSTRRTDKSFPLSSYELACELGGTLLEAFPQLKVNLNEPDWELGVEIREKAFLYGLEKEGPGGLPVGCSGKGILLLSGGIDSPVAGYLMAKRGLGIKAIYFHTHPFTSEKAKDKVIKLMGVLSTYLPRSELFIIPFTEVQLAIKELAPAPYITVLSRAAMMRLAGWLAVQEQAGCLVTGESLGQVASQTLESMNFTGSNSTVMTLRPLVGMDKESIIKIARALGTYEISILPHLDCCSVFAPEHPVIRPNFKEMQAVFKQLNIDALLQQALTNAEKITYPAPAEVKRPG